MTPGSPHAAEAALPHRAASGAARAATSPATRPWPTRFPGTPWAEEALLATRRNFYQKDARDDEALPYLPAARRRLPRGQIRRRGDLARRLGRYAPGATTRPRTLLEKAAAARPRSGLRRGLPLLGGPVRARELGERSARARFDEGRAPLQARLPRHARAGGAGLPRCPTRRRRALARARHPARRAGAAAPRMRQLLLIERLDGGLDELRHAARRRRRCRRRAPGSSGAAASCGRRSRRCGAPIPDTSGEAATRCRDAVWRILYPLQFEERPARKAAAATGLDPALVAALIWQESTFDPGAVSGAGARGLMQIMPPTGRALARGLGIKYQHRRAARPADAASSFGTRYLRE